MKQFMFALTIAAAAVFSAPAAKAAEPAAPGNQPYVFYSEEPWGGGSYLGVDTEDITADKLGPLHLKEERGVEVTMVDQDAPAGKAGFKERDVILSINDQQVQSVEQLRRMIHEIPAGRTISIGISRDGQPMTLKAQLADRGKMGGMEHAFNFTVPAINIPAINIPPINMPQMDFANVVVIHSPVRSGLMIENLTPQLGEFFGVKSGNGVLVRSVEKGSRGESAGFRAGDVIVKINGSAVGDCSDFTRLLYKGEDKAAVTVLRDRKEQNLTLTLPGPKHTGAVMEPSSEDEPCAELTGPEQEMAQLKMHLAVVDKEAVKQAAVQMKLLKPEMEKLQRQYRMEIQGHQVEIQQQVEKMQKDMLKQKDEMKKELKQWWNKESEI